MPQTIAVQSVAKMKSLKVKLALSGTSIENKITDIIGQLKFIGRLNDLGGWMGFTNKYCIPGEWGGFEREGKNIIELNGKMREGGMYLRRLKKDVLPELPAKQRTVIHLPVESKDLAAYRSRAAIGYDNQKKGDMLKFLTELRILLSKAKLASAKRWCQQVMEQPPSTQRPVK